MKLTPSPAVFLSGGLDSTILLHHLREQTEEEIYTYYVRLPGFDESPHASMVAEHYGTIHRTIQIKHFMEALGKLQVYFDRPRWNIWPYWGYRAAWEDGCQNVYIGEGMDEHFGGYWYKPDVTYQEYWSSVLEWSIPLHKQIANMYDLNLHTPFLFLEVSETKPYWDSKTRNKELLRKCYSAYTDLPVAILERKKNPGRVDFLKIWDEEISPYIKCKHPENRRESYNQINKWTMEKWVQCH